MMSDILFTKYFHKSNAYFHCTTLGLHYDHYVGPSVRLSIRSLRVSENVYIFWTTWYIIYICMSKFPNHWHAEPPFLIEQNRTKFYQT